MDPARLLSLPPQSVLPNKILMMYDMLPIAVILTSIVDAYGHKNLATRAAAVVGRQQKPKYGSLCKLSDVTSAGEIDIEGSIGCVTLPRDTAS